MSSIIPLTILSLYTDETVRNLSIEFSVALLLLVAHEGESVYIRRVPNVCLAKHGCQKRSDWMFTINHPIAVNITNKALQVIA
jgi:hypothetical protein